MKKILILILALAMSFALAPATMASTLGVNVDQGYVISLEKPDTDGDPFLITGKFGISDQWLLSIGYQTEDEWDNDGFQIGVRYEFVKNGAIALTYGSYDDYDQWTIDLRGKLDISDKLAFTGLLGYIDPDYTDETFRALGQAEYNFTDWVTGNLGIDYYNNDVEDTTLIVAGLEFYPVKDMTLWVDYNYDTDADEDEDWFGFGVEFKF